MAEQYDFDIQGAGRNERLRYCLGTDTQDPEQYDQGCSSTNLSIHGILRKLNFILYSRVLFSPLEEFSCQTILAICSKLVARRYVRKALFYASYYFGGIARIG